MFELPIPIPQSKHCFDIKKLSFRSKYKQKQAPETNPSFPCICHNTLFFVGIKTSNSYKASESIKNCFGSSAYYNQTIHIETFYYTNNNMGNASKFHSRPCTASWAKYYAHSTSRKIRKKSFLLCRK